VAIEGINCVMIKCCEATVPFGQLEGLSAILQCAE